MNWRERIGQWPQWPGWRKHAPAIGSVAVHAVVFSAIAGMMAAAAPEKKQRERPYLAVQLVAPPELTQVEAGVTPPPRPRTAPTPSTAAPRPAGPSTTTPSATPPDADKDDGNSFYIGPPLVPDAPPGLASLMGNDPCAVKFGPKPKECAGRDLARRTGPMDSNMPRDQQQLAQFYGEFMPKCTMRVGCEGGEWISSIGTRGVGKPALGSANDHGVGTPGAGGAASLGGLHTSVGRLGFNREHTDPGFGD